MRHMMIAGTMIAASTLTMASEPRPAARRDVSPAIGAAVARADAAIDAFRDRVFLRLNELIVQGGPAHAIQVCRSDAPAIAKQVAQQQHVRLGRTSHRLRNPENAPPPWARAFVQAAGGKKAGDVDPAVVDLGDRIGVLRPITLMTMCRRCHGADEWIDPEVRAELARQYPADQATQFAPGDLRGFFWVEVTKR